MNILFLDQFSEFGGAQLCLRDVLCEVKQRGWQATVAAPGAGPLLQFAQTLGYETATLPLSAYSNGRKSFQDLLRYPAETLSSVRFVRQKCREARFDLIYVNGPRVLPSVAATDVPVLFHSHNLLDKKYAQKIVFWSLRRRRTAVLACSEFIARSLQTFLTQPVKTIYNGVADCGFTARARNSGPLRIGILGRISPEKGHLDFVKAARQLKQCGKQSDQFQFVVIGAALFSDPAYERAVRQLGSEAGVEFQGWTNNPAAALHSLDILAVPSGAAEASPRVIMEALSAGTALVAYPAGGIPELICNGQDGMLTDASTSGALAKTIQLLAEHRELRQSLAENGRKTWQARFTVQRFRREVCDEMTALCASAVSSALPAKPYAHDATSASP